MIILVVEFNLIQISGKCRPLVVNILSDFMLYSILLSTELYVEKLRT